MTTVTSTSRVGRKPISIPKGVEVRVQGSKLSIKGPKGQLEMDVHPYTSLKIENEHINVALADDGDHHIVGPNKKLYNSIAGTMRSKINSVVSGVSHGFSESLTLVGVGYRAQAKGQIVSLSLGFSHPTDYHVPKGITVETPTPTEIIVKGIDKALVGQVASELRNNYRSPEPYKGKGIRYRDEEIEIKETKKK